MVNSDPFLCPECGWTGARVDTVDFDDAVKCPVCKELVEQRHDTEETAESNPVMCPVCGWSGDQDKLTHVNGDKQCPVCEEIMEFID